MIRRSTFIFVSSLMSYIYAKKKLVEKD